MDDVLRYVDPRFVYPYMRRDKPNGELVVDETYMQGLAEFTGKPKIVENIELWCTTAKVLGEGTGKQDVPKKAQLALTSRVAETFVLAVSVPDEWLTKQGLPLLCKKLAKWVGPDVSGKDSLLAMTTFQLIARKVRGEENKYHKLCCDALASMVHAAQERHRVEAQVEMELGVCFPATVPALTRDVVCLLGHIFPVSLPCFVLPPGKGEYIERMDVWTLIGRMPETMGLACEESFQRAIPGATLHHVLVFCCENWAEEWRRRGWSTSRQTRAGLKALHVGGWRFGRTDARDMMFFSVYERKYES